MPTALRRVAWRRALLRPHEERRCVEQLRLAAADADGGSGRGVSSVVRQMLTRGLAGAPPAERARLEARAKALLLRAHACAGAQLPAAFGPLALGLLHGAADEAREREAYRHSEAAAAAVAAARGTAAEPAARRHAAVAEATAAAAVDGPLVAMLIELEGRCLPQAVAAAKAPLDEATGDGGVLARVEQWPRLRRHLLAVCGRADINQGVEIVARRAVPAADAPPPQASLLRLVETEWLRPGFVGALPWEAALWAWDQGVTQGWGALSEVAAACLWLLRREVRRLDRACAGVEELREAMRTALRGASLAELQALLAARSRRTRAGAGGVMKAHGPRLHYEYTPKAERAEEEEEVDD